MILNQCSAYDYVEDGRRFQSRGGYEGLAGVFDKPFLSAPQLHQTTQEKKGEQLLLI